MPVDRSKSQQHSPVPTSLREERVMLVLSRKLGQSFNVGNGIRVTVVKIDGNSVRVGIEAPEDVPIRRQEIAFESPEPRVKEVARA
jgi:carbon storage regulator